MSLFDTLKEALDGDAVGTLAGKIGIDPAQAKAAISSALPTILSALAKNTKSEEGAAKLDKALDKHDGGVMAKLQAAAPDLLKEGEKVLGHLFGKKQEAATGQVAAAAMGSGLDISKIGDLLKGLAPVVISALSHKKKTEGLDAAGVAQQLQADGDKAKAESGGTLAFLDADGDGDPMNDIMSKGKDLLGGIFGAGGGGDEKKEDADKPETKA